MANVSTDEAWTRQTNLHAQRIMSSQTPSSSSNTYSSSGQSMNGWMLNKIRARIKRNKCSTLSIKQGFLEVKGESGMLPKNERVQPYPYNLKI